MPTAIRVENVSKLYRIGSGGGNYRTLRDTLSHAASACGRGLRRLFPWARPAPQPGPPPGSPPDTIWALNNVSFDIRAGEVVGIIGRNGAGKSTLLKVLSRVTEPTSGRVQLRGRVGSLLEVGTGFHPELTGRENVYLYGATLGMTRREIARKFDDIVAFSEIEQFLDTPVKRYSSGMYVRLGFAVAAHLEPEIFLVDEVLAVGDAGFQAKCFRHFDALRKSGTTILLVSHQLETLKLTCRRIVLLDKGAVWHDGDPASVLNGYRKLVAEQQKEARTSPTLAEEQSVQILDLEWSDPGSGLREVTVGRPVTFVISYRVTKRVENPVFTLSFTSADKRVYTGCSMAYDGYRMGPLPAGEGKVALTFPFFGLEPGVYDVHVGVWREDGFAPYDWQWDYRSIMVQGQKRVMGTFEFQHNWAAPERPADGDERVASSQGSVGD